MTAAYKVIQTRYNGFHFRSRHEARWAVFFDALGLCWEYESEGFVLPGGLQYLPDFFLPDLNVWFEIKPAAWLSNEDSMKHQWFSMQHPFVCLYGLPGAFDHCDHESATDLLEWGQCSRCGSACFGHMHGKQYIGYASCSPSGRFPCGQFYANTTFVEEAVDIARSARFEFGEQQKILRRKAAINAELERRRRWEVAA